MDTTGHNRPGPDDIVIDRLLLEDTTVWLGNLEDWLLHADSGHAREFAGFLGHSPGRADLAAAGLVGDIGSIAAALHHLLTNSLANHPDPARTTP